MALFVFPAPPVHGTSIRSITIDGNSVFTSREILDWLSSKPSLPYSRAIIGSDIRVITENYRKRGYLSMNVDPLSESFTSDSALVDLVINIIENRQTVLGAIITMGHQEFTDSEILSEFDLQPGDPIDEAVLEQDIEALLDRYEKLGYAFAQCRITRMVENVGEENNTIDLTLTIDEGQRVTIDEIRVEGNKETDPSVVVRETRLSFGEIYNPIKVNAIRQRLNRLNIFADVSEPELYIREKKGGLLIKVQEGNTNTFDGVIGYIPAGSTGQSGYVTGLASVSMRNLFGTGRKFSFRWHREDRFSQDLGFRYLEPWVFGLPANVGGGFAQRQQDTSYVRRVFDLKTELMLSEELSVSLLFGSENVIPSADTTINRVFRSSTITFGAELQYDTRDDFYSPTSGATYRTDYQYGRKKISGIPASLASQVASRVTVQKFTLDLDFFLSTFSRQVLAFGLHGRELQSGHVEEGEMFRLGGARTLRGYRENQFLGSRLAWANTEYRFLLARRSFLYGFIDTGYYFRPADDARSIPKSDAFKYGYGIGVQLETGLGNLGVSFALGQGDSFSNGKIHFGLINEF
ncbi:MAG: BamA/TamA family outer membrane protein [Ignavibacteriae bacterium]|nr:BamA/TamA family outer membrane protein [Ignavibacteriota bacterium]